MDREQTRRTVLPAVIQGISDLTGLVIAIYRNYDHIRLVTKGSKFTYNVDLWDDKLCTIDGGDCGRVTAEHSLLDLVPVCRGLSCSYKCGCRCSADLGYTINLMNINIDSSNIFSCKSRHVKKHVCPEV